MDRDLIADGPCVSMNDWNNLEAVVKIDEVKGISSILMMIKLRDPMDLVSISLNFLGILLAMMSF